jgi:neutral trehalase
MGKHDNFPRIHFYDQDFIDIYDRTWALIQDCWQRDLGNPAFSGKFFAYPDAQFITQSDALSSSFFLVYSNRIYPANTTLDILYGLQEENGAIRAAYDLKTAKPASLTDNPEAVGMPLFAWAEFNLYHKAANKKRIKEVIPIIDRYHAWLDATFKAPNGLYNAPWRAGGMWNAPRDGTVYPIDFNAMVAVDVLYMSALADILNDKDTSFRYKKQYFSLKTRLNSLMWSNDDNAKDGEEPSSRGFYYDLDKDEKQIKVKTLASYWTLLAEVPNEDKAERLIKKLTNKEYFGAEHPFPSLATNEPTFSADGEGFRGSVFPMLNFMVIKGLERYQQWELARECAMRHLYYALDSMSIDGEERKTGFFEAYLPGGAGRAIAPADLPPEHKDFPETRCLATAGLSTICLIVENVLGITVSLPRKTVEWVIPNLEIMGIENLSLKKNMITILSVKAGRGWEIQVESEKLYYFTINILNKKKKTLPIPSGKCSLLIDKL